VGIGGFRGGGWGAAAPPLGQEILLTKIFFILKIHIFVNKNTFLVLKIHIFQKNTFLVLKIRLVNS